MFSTIHGTVGAIIGQTTNNIFLGFFGGILSHFLLDAIPHGDEMLIADSKHPTKSEIKKVIFIATVDFILMIVVLASLWWSNNLSMNWSVISGIVGGLIPDAINALYIFCRWKFIESFNGFHGRVHHLILQKDITLSQGLIVQFITAVIIIGIFILN